MDMLIEHFSHENSGWKGLGIAAWSSFGRVHVKCCYCCKGRKVCLYGNAAINGPIVQPPDDAWLNVEQWWNDIGKGKRKNLEKSLSQYHFVHHKSHMDCAGRIPDLCSEKPVTNCLSYGTACVLYVYLIFCTL
jgi:hypothetical protein